VKRWEGVLEQVPLEVRLAGWVGPTLFTSEVREGDLATLDAFAPLPSKHNHAKSLVFGTVRETQGVIASAYSAFCIDPATGGIVLVDLDPPYRTIIVNTGLVEFVASLRAFVDAWPTIASAHERTIPGILGDLRSQLGAIDPNAMSDDEWFWPTCVSQCGDPG
jgi:hypothetical protein